jgi:hypothetical protein
LGAVPLELAVSEVLKSKSSTLCVRVHGDLRDCIKEWAARKQISQSDAVRLVLAERLMDGARARPVAL